jgi:NADH dehydrogenase/NADH:ubiquinone oxidoreductase subunit G
MKWLKDNKVIAVLIVVVLAMSMGGVAFAANSMNNNIDKSDDRVTQLQHQQAAMAAAAAKAKADATKAAAVAKEKKAAADLAQAKRDTAQAKKDAVAAKKKASHAAANRCPAADYTFVPGKGCLSFLRYSASGRPAAKQKPNTDSAPPLPSANDADIHACTKYNINQGTALCSVDGLRRLGLGAGPTDIHACTKYNIANGTSLCSEAGLRK